MEVSKRNATALLSISRELPILKNEVLDASPLYWNEDFVKAVDALRVKKILKNLKIFSPEKRPADFRLAEFSPDAGGHHRKIRRPFLPYQCKADL